MNRIDTRYKTRQGEVALTADVVLRKMEENDNLFSNPPPALSALKKLLPEFNQALVNAMGREKRMVAIKDQIKEKVVDLLQELADYVTEISEGDRTKMLSSGFDVYEENGTSNKQPPTIEKLEVDVSRPGEAYMRIRKVKNAIAFIHQYTAEPPHLHTIWIGEGTSLGSYTFRGLDPEKRYWFRVVAIGYHGLRGYSPVVTRVIQ